MLAAARRSRAQTLRPVLDQLGEADRARLRDAVEVLRAVVDAATPTAARRAVRPDGSPPTRPAAPQPAPSPDLTLTLRPDQK